MDWDQPIRPSWDQPGLRAWQKRKAWVQEEGPRFVYKFRCLPAHQDTEAIRQFECLMLYNQLWMATPASFSDVMDTEIRFVSTKSGPELRRALDRWLRKAGRQTSAQVRKREKHMPWSLSELTANRALLDQLFRTTHEAFKSTIGVCSMCMTARELPMWDNYAGGHRGIGLQFAPWLDPVALMGLEIDYSDDPPTITDWYDAGEEERDRVLQLSLKKFSSYAYEKEYRVLDAARGNYNRPFRPQALTGVLLGTRVDPAQRQWLMQLLQQRKQTTNHMPRVFEAYIRDGRVRFRAA